MKIAMDEYRDMLRRIADDVQESGHELFGMDILREDGRLTRVIGKVYDLRSGPEETT